MVALIHTDIFSPSHFQMFISLGRSTQVVAWGKSKIMTITKSPVANWSECAFCANTLTHSLFIIKTSCFGAIRLQTARKIFNQLHNRPHNRKKWCQSREFIVSLSRVQDVVCAVCLIGTNPWWEKEREREGKKRVYDSNFECVLCLANKNKAATTDTQNALICERWDMGQRMWEWA